MSSSTTRITFDKQGPYTHQFILAREGNAQALEESIHRGSFEISNDDLLLQVAKLSDDHHLSEEEARATYELLVENNRWAEILQNPPCADPQIAYHLLTNELRLRHPKLSTSIGYYFKVENPQCYHEIKAAIGDETSRLLNGLHFYVHTWSADFPQTNWKQIDQSIVMFLSRPEEDGLLVGSGVLIAPNLVLTARHVVAATDENGNLTRDHEGKANIRHPIYVGIPHGKESIKIEVKPEKIFINELLGLKNDIALVYLDKAVTQAPTVDLAGQNPKLGDSIVLAGWPVFDVGDLPTKKFSVLGPLTQSKITGLLSVNAGAIYGYSGGACLNTEGQLVGLVTSLFKDRTTGCIDLKGGQTIHERLFLAPVKHTAMILSMSLGLAVLMIPGNFAISSYSLARSIDILGV